MITLEEIRKMQLESMRRDLERIRTIRDSSSGEVRQLLNVACDRIDVAISKVVNNE